MPEMGFTCLVCPGKPSVITGGMPGDTDALLKAATAGVEHLREGHGDVINSASDMTRILDVSPRTVAGPTEPLNATT